MTSINLACETEPKDYLRAEVYGTQVTVIVKNVCGGICEADLSRESLVLLRAFIDKAIISIYIEENKHG